MAKKKFIKIPWVDTSKWLCTFNDLMTLLLTFFVLILSMSSLDAKAVKEIQSQLINALGVMEAGKMEEETIIEKIFKLEEIGKKLKIFKNMLPPLDVESKDEAPMEDGIRPERLFEELLLIKEEGRKKIVDHDEEYVFNQFKEIMIKEYSQPELVIIKRERGVVLSLGENILFGPGEAKLNKRAYPLLESVSSVIKKSKLYIYIEGHTDSKPIKTAKYPSNWELSVARSVSVVEHLIQKCSVPPERIGIAGYGESLPIAPNDTEENRSKNRRIEIILSKF